MHAFPLTEEPRVVTNGTIIMNVKYGVVPHMSGTINLCDCLPQKCPVKPGQGSLIIENPIPSYKPPVSYIFYNRVELMLRMTT